MVVLLSGFAVPGKRKKVLIIGDSISIGYTPFVALRLKDVAEVTHNPGNGRYSAYGLAHLREWIGDAHWDVIQINWGLWDLAHRDSTGRLDRNSPITAPLGTYEANLRAIVKILKSTGAKIVYVTTTYVPKGEPGRDTRDVSRYNAVAVRVMKENGIAVNDLYRPSRKIHHRHGLKTNNVHYTPPGYDALSHYVSSFLREQL